MYGENIQKPDFREAVKDLTLMDDVLMRTVMKDKRCASMCFASFWTILILFFMEAIRKLI